MYFRKISLSVALFAGLVPSALRQESQPPTAAPPRSHRMPVRYTFIYNCDAGAMLTVYLREHSAQVIFKDKSYSMHQVQAASGTRYSDGNVTWWSKGYDGFLQDETNPSQPLLLAENCHQVSPPPTYAMPSVSGTVTYRERMAMPENAVLSVQLQDVSRADAPAEAIAEQRITFAGRQVPLGFELRYDPGRINPKHLYAVSASITVDGQLRFLNSSTYRVLTQGNPVKLGILVHSPVAVGRSSPD
jgi:putative lipoprotein